jgi:hypothetical protein
VARKKAGTNLVAPPKIIYRRNYELEEDQRVTVLALGELSTRLKDCIARLEQVSNQLAMVERLHKEQTWNTNLRLDRLEKNAGSDDNSGTARDR